jgi:ribosomal-protein-alanine N-acetyltransferase
VSTPNRPPARCRPACGDADLATLAALEVACFDHPWSAAGIAAELAPTGGTAWLLEADRNVQAYAIFRRLDGEAELLRIGVAPAARGRGNARTLLEAALASLAAAGVEVCHLEVRADNQPAIAVYQRCGFRRVGERRGYYADGTTALLMTAQLEGTRAP